MSTSKRQNPFSERLREIASHIDQLLRDYESFKKNNKITTASDPNLLYYDLEEELRKNNKTNPTTNNKNSDENPDENPDQTPMPHPNPVFSALIRLGELTPEDALRFETLHKIAVLRALGAQRIIECTVLIQWARKLAADFTYLLETKVTYSEEVKARFPELLVDLDTARGYADRLVRTIGMKEGYLSLDEYHEQVGTLLHYATIISRAARQLADYHEEFTVRGVSPLVEPETVEYVIEGEEKPTRQKGEEEESL